MTTNPKRIFEYLVISVDEERKASFIKQYKDLSLSAPFSFLENPATVQNLQSFVECIEEDKFKKVICCLISHIRAIRQAVKKTPPSTEYVVIFEDDVAIRKTMFEEAVQEIVDRWEELVLPDKIASIGWIPCKEYPVYVEAASSSVRCLKTPLSSSPTKILRDRYVPGLQGYIIRKSDFEAFANVLGGSDGEGENSEKIIKSQISYFDFKRKLDENFPHPHIKGKKIIASDSFLNFIFGQVVVFPHLVVEQDFTSIIGNSNVVHYWNNFFAGEFESKKNDYYFL
jgi:hypothetical protein